MQDNTRTPLPPDKLSKLFFSRQHDRCQCRAMCLWKNISTLIDLEEIVSENYSRGVCIFLRIIVVHIYDIPNILSTRCVGSSPRHRHFFLREKGAVSWLPSVARGGGCETRRSMREPAEIISNTIIADIHYPLADIATWLSRLMGNILYNLH